MARDDPHFRLRLPVSLKERVEVLSAQSGRSINAEIVHLLNAAIEQQKNAPAARKTELEDLSKLFDQFERIQREDRAVLAEVDAIEGYLQSDAIAMQARLNHDRIEPSAIRPSLNTSSAQSLAVAIDHWAWVLAKAIRELVRSVDDEKSAAFAMYQRHRIEGSELHDDIYDAYIKEVDGLLGKANGDDFYDAMLDRIAAASDELRPGMKAALDHLMPRLFPEQS